MKNFCQIIKIEILFYFCKKYYLQKTKNTNLLIVKFQSKFN